MSEALSHSEGYLPYVSPPDRLAGVRVAVSDGARDVTGGALDAWRPWPGLAFLVPGSLAGALASAQPWNASGVQIVGLGMAWLTLAAVQAPHLPAPRFFRGAQPAHHTPAVVSASWLVPIMLLLLGLFAPPELMPHEQLMLGAAGVLGSWWMLASAMLRDRPARELLARLVEAENADQASDAEPGGSTLWASTYVELGDGHRTTIIPADGVRLRVADAILGGSAQAEPRRYAGRVLAHHRLRISAGLAAAAAHTAATVIALIV